jgi:hypothetical protein
MAERHIQEALHRGDFDDLALKGQPLSREDLSGVPEELRMGYKILKNAGYLPEEMQLHREILSLRNLLDCCEDQTESRQLKNRLSLRQLQYDMLMERNGRKAGFRQYTDQLAERLTSEERRLPA